MSCAVLGCKSNTSRKQNDDVFISHHRFPENNEYKTKWLQAINRPNWNPDTRRVCSKHFTMECFVNKDDLKWRRLKPEAVPTLLLPQRQKILLLETVDTQSKETPCTSTSLKPYIDSLLKDIACFSQNTPMEVDAKVTSNENPEIECAKRPLLEQSASAQTSEIEHLKNELNLSKINLSKMTKIAKRRLLKVNALNKKKNRMQQKNIVLNTLLENVLKNEEIAREQSILLENLKSNEIIRRVITQIEGDELPREYSPGLKKFAVTLHTISPKAYNFVRDEFNNVLPHSKTILSWYNYIKCEQGVKKKFLEKTILFKGL